MRCEIHVTDTFRLAAKAIWLLAFAIGSGSCGTASEGSPNTAGNPSSGGGAGAPGSGGSAGSAGNLSSTGGSSGTSGSGGMLAVSGAGGVGAASGGAGAATAASGGTSSGGGSSAGAGGAAAGNGADGGGAGTAGAQAALCPESPIARRMLGTMLELPIKPTLQGKPLLYAESNPLDSGGTLTPLDLRFYVSEVALLRAAAEPVPVDVVTSEGTPASYGVHLYSAEDASSNSLRVLAPAGDYVGIQFLLGLAQACNVRRAEESAAPLSATSQMSWPHTGFLFLRYQGRSTPPSTTPASGGAGGVGSVDPMPAFPPVIHMGGSLFQALAPLVRVDGAFSVPASGSVSKSMLFVLDDVFKGALMDVDLSGFIGPPGEEVLLGERLRRSMPGLHLFAFEP